MKILNLLLLTCLSLSAQVTKPVMVYSTNGLIQWPTNFFSTNITASGGTVLSFDQYGRMNISSVAGSGTNSLIQTNGINLGSIGTLNFTDGLTGYVSAGVVYIGNSVAGGGDVTTAQLLVVSNQMIASSNYSFNAIGITSNKFQTDVVNLQGATNGLQSMTLNASNVLRTDISNLQGATNGLHTRVTNLEGATNSFNSTNANLATHINNVATNTIKWLTNIWGDVARGFEGLSDGQVLTYKTASGTWTNQTPSAGSGSPGGNSGAIQFNETGVFAGTNEFIFDRTNRYVRLISGDARYNVELAGLGTNWISSVFMIATNRANQALQVGVVNIGVPNGLSIQSNNISPMFSTLSNHSDFGAYILPWRTNYAETFVANQAIRLGNTNSGSGTIFSNNGIFRPTNVFVFNVTNPTAGQVFKFHSITYGGATATIILTNDVDNLGGGGAGLITNANQFGPSPTLTLNTGLFVTNIYVYNHLIVSNESFNQTLPTNHLAIGRDSYGGRALIESWDDQNLSIAYQPFLGNNRVHMILPGTTVTTVSGYGMATPVTLGGLTVSQPPPTEEWPLMTQLATAATSNACAGVFSSADMTTMGTRYGLNGYFLATEFMSTNLLVTNLTAPAGNRLFIGRTSTASPNLTNIVNTTNATGQYAGLYADCGNSAQFFLTVRDGTAEFRTNTGIFWRATNLYQFYMMQAPTSKFLSWKLKDMTAGITTEGWFSNNVPTNMMKFGYLIRNGTTVVHSIRFNKMYVEAPLSP